MSDESYVSNAAWLRTTGRVDTIDDVADQFERPAAWPSGPSEFWTGGARWRSCNSWRAILRGFREPATHPLRCSRPSRSWRCTGVAGKWKSP